MLYQAKRVVFLNLSTFKSYSMNYLTIAWHVCTYLNAFLMVKPNVVMKCNKFDFSICNTKLTGHLRCGKS